MIQNNSKKGNLFGFGIVMYGFLDLLFRHTGDFAVLMSHIFSNYFFEEYRPLEHKIRYITTDLDNRINSRTGELGSYLSIIPFLIGSIGFLKLKFGGKIRQDICSLMGDLKDLFSDAGFVFKNAPTKIQHRQSPGVGLKVLHFLDRPRNCFPSLHVILASYSYLKTKELISKYSADHRIYYRENNFLLDWSRRIIESCLITKQHSIRDVAGGLALVSAKYPQFGKHDTEELINSMFLNNPHDFPADAVDMVRKEINSVYLRLTMATDSQNGNYRSALVDYVRSI